ncbi:MAG: 3-dehydroquinate synthase [Rikenellaceae bacterium]
MENIIKVETASKVSIVTIGESKRLLPQYLAGCNNVFVITDSSIKSNYPELINSYTHIVIGQGEEHKTLADLLPIHTALLEAGVDRHSTIVGIGGGIVTDITGFVASTYQRGVDFGFVSTTLLAQVDASVGGKNGVNHQGFKNMIGVFNQPRFVICDTSMLKTLSEREFRAGLSEIIKAGVIKDSSLFEKFETNSFEQFKNNRALLDSTTYSSIEIKARVVEQDERESGERKKLNFGHTLAHAIEKLSREYNHGEAVAIGMVMAANLGVKRGVTPLDVASRIFKVVESMGLPTECDIAMSDLFNALKSDKKRKGDGIDFILPSQIGTAEIVPFTFAELELLFVGDTTSK